MLVDKRQHRAVVYISLSALSLSLFFLFVKLGEQENISFFFLSFLRFLVPLLFTLPFFFYNGIFKEILFFKQAKFHGVRTFFVLLQQYAIFFYLTQFSLLDATALLNIAPLFILLLEWMFFKHHATRVMIVSLLIAFIGVLLVLQPDLALFSFGSLIGLLGALGSAGSQVFYGRNVQNERQEISLFYLFFLGALVSGVILLLSGLFFGVDVAQEFNHLFRLDNNSSILFLVYLVLMSFCTLFNQYFRGKAYSLMPPIFLAPFLYFTVFFAGGLDWAVFQNPPNILAVLGSLLILIGAFLQIYLRKELKG